MNIDDKINQLDDLGRKHGRWVMRYNNMIYVQYELTFFHGEAQGLVKKFFPYEHLVGCEWTRFFLQSDVAEGEEVRFLYS